MTQDTLEDGHAIVVYGVNGIGKLLIVDEGSHLHLVNIYESLRYSMPIQPTGNSRYDVIIVKEPSANSQ